jgi:hypothetical protein
MTLSEKLLYQQIHAGKLATDIGSSIAATVLFWQHQLTIALVAGLVPAVLATALLVGFADLDAHKDSRFGRYLREHMTRAVEAQRFAGQAVAWLGAWQHQPILIALGALVIVLAWLR